MSNKNLTDKQWNRIGQHISMLDNERNSKEIIEEKSVLPKLRQVARELSFDFNNDSQLGGICFDNSNVFKEILLDLYKKSFYIAEKEYLLNCLGAPNNKDLVEFFIEELYKYDSLVIKFAIGNCLMRNSNEDFVDKYIELLYDNNYKEVAPYAGHCLVQLANLKHKDRYLELLDDDNLDHNRLYIIQVIGKLKFKEAIPKLIELLNDKYLCEFVLDALNRFKDPSLLQYFERYKDDKDSFARSSARTGIKTIEKMQSTH